MFEVDRQSDRQADRLGKCRSFHGESRDVCVYFVIRSQLFLYYQHAKGRS